MGYCFLSTNSVCSSGQKCFDTLACDKWSRNKIIHSEVSIYSTKHNGVTIIFILKFVGTSATSTCFPDLQSEFFHTASTWSSSPPKIHALLICFMNLVLKNHPYFVIMIHPVLMYSLWGSSRIHRTVVTSLTFI